jgi:hypothetical protein
MRFGLGTIVSTGIIAAMIFAMFEMLAAGMLMGPDAFAMPLRMIGAIVLGPMALEPSYSLIGAATTGIVVHLILSMLFAGIFAVTISAMTPPDAASVGSMPGGLALAGICFGIVLWLVNFYVVAPLAGWTWFAARSDPFVQLFAHALFFGCPVGWLLGNARTVITA